jgi:enoyl-CoA hydratase
MSIEFTQETERPHVAHLRLDFNELNLLTVAEADELRDSVLAVPEEVAVLTIGAEQPAAGEAEIRGLTGGLNLEWAHSLGPREGQELLETLYETIEAVRELDAVVICSCGSYTLGAGFELAMACEFRVATADASLGLPEVNVGLPTVIHGGLLTRLAGAQTATELIYTGKTISGERAAALELVNRAVDPDDYDDALEQLVSSVADKPPQVLKAQKRVMRRFRSVGLEQGMEASIGDMGRVFGTDTQRDAMGAFLED